LTSIAHFSKELFKIALTRQTEIELAEQDKESCALRIFRSSRASTAKAGSMHIVISSQFAFLEEVLRSAFEGQSDVTVRVDRREKSERRKSNHPVTSDKRKMERRRLKAELLEVVIDT
jgi:hypothetical protein